LQLFFNKDLFKKYYIELLKIQSNIFFCFNINKFNKYLLSNRYLIADYLKKTLIFTTTKETTIKIIFTK